MNEHPPATRTIREVATSLRLCIFAARKRAEGEKIRGRKVGRRRLREEALDKWLDPDKPCLDRQA